MSDQEYVERLIKDYFVDRLQAIDIVRDPRFPENVKELTPRTVDVPPSPIELYISVGGQV